MWKRKRKFNKEDLCAKNTVTIANLDKMTLVLNCDMVIISVAEKRLEFNLPDAIRSYDSIIINGVEYNKAN